MSNSLSSKTVTCDIQTIKVNQESVEMQEIYETGNGCSNGWNAISRGGVVEGVGARSPIDSNNIMIGALQEGASDDSIDWRLVVVVPSMDNKSSTGGS